MNIYNFFHSPDIAEHCRKTGHIFSPLDMAIIVAISDKPLKEKHAAYKTIIAEYPDMPIHGSLNFKAKPSFHEYLRELIEFEERQLDEFFTPEENTFCRLNVWCRCNDVSKESFEYIDSPIFSAFEQAKQAFYGKYGEDDRVFDVLITKGYINDYDRCQIAPLDNNFNVIKILLSHGDRVYRNWDCLDMVFFHLPVPFEKGDLVMTKDGTPLVLDWLPHWGAGSNYTYEDYITGKHGNGTDMSPNCYLIYEGALERSHEHCSLQELRYFDGELKGQERFLKYLSRYIKTKDDGIDWLIAVFCKFKAEAEVEKWDNLFGSVWFRSLEEEII